MPQLPTARRIGDTGVCPSKARSCTCRPISLSSWHCHSSGPGECSSAVPGWPHLKDGLKRDLDLNPERYLEGRFGDLELRYFASLLPISIAQMYRQSNG